MIFTSYYGKLRELVQSGIEPISISRSCPAGFAGRKIEKLAPTWAMLKMSDEDYNKHYEQILAGIDRDALVKTFGGKDVALLCWEKDINDCHRKRVGEWLREGGYEVEEFKSEKDRIAEQKKEEQKKDAEVAQMMNRAQISMWDMLITL